MKLVELVNSKDEFNELSIVKLDPKVSLKLIRYGKMISEEISNFEKARLEKYKEIGEAKEEGRNTTYIVPEEKREEITSFINGLLESEVPIIIDKLKISDLGSNQIKPISLVKLSWLIDINE